MTDEKIAFMISIVKEITWSYVPDPTQLDKTAKKKGAKKQAAEDKKIE